MPKKNLFLFIIVSALILGGWWWWQFHWLEQAKPPAESSAKSKPKVETQKEVKPEPHLKTLPRPRKLTEQEQLEILGRLTALAPTLHGGAPELVRLLLCLGGDKALLTAPRPPIKAEEIAKDLQLGDPKNPDYYVLAMVTTRGGGIRNLTLPKFQKADENGQPVFADGIKVPLQLLEDDPIIASFLMSHYPTPAKEECVTTLGQKTWKVDRDQPHADKCELVLYFDQLPDYPDLKIVKTYTLKPKEYHIGLTVEIHDKRDKNGADQAVREFRYQLAGSHGLPIEGYWYTSVYRTPMIGIVDERGNLQRDLEETQNRISVREGGDRVPPATLGDNWMQYAGVATQYFASLIVVDDQQDGIKPADVLAYCRPTLESEEVHGLIDRIDTLDPNKVELRLLLLPKAPVPASQRFLLLPRTKVEMDKKELKVGAEVLVSFYRSFDNKLIATGIRPGSVRHRQFDDITVRTVSNALKLKPGSQVVHKYLLYHGPSKVRLLAQFTGDKAVAPELVDRYVDTLHLSTLTDYRSAGPFGWFAQKIMWTDILILTTRFMHWLLDWLHWLVPNYGLSIILLTLIVRGSMFPISRRTAQLSVRMQALAPEMKKLQEKYKDDPQAKTAAMMELYRKHGVNPLGSCLPMLLQMPFFLGLYYCLQESIHFRLAGFWPLWIDNLAAPDMLLRWGDGIWIISDTDNISGSFLSFLYLGPFFNVLPVVAVALMLVQQKMLTPPPADEQQEMQQKMMKYMFVFIGIMFYKVAAGLCVYFIVSSLWGLAERKMLPKKSTAPVAGAGPSGGGGNGPSGGGPTRGKGKPPRKDKDKKAETPIQKVKDWWAEVLRSAQKK